MSLHEELTELADRWARLGWHLKAEALRSVLARHPEPGVRERLDLVRAIEGGTISCAHGYSDLAHDDAENIVDALLAVGPDPSASGMDMVGAFDATIDLAADHWMSEAEASDPSLSWEHLLDMRRRVHAGDISRGKLGRWLGWAQAAVVAANIGVTLDDVKAINLRHADSPQLQVQAPAPVVGDEHHTMDELYAYRMAYHAHAAQGWLAAGIPVVKSWRHSDGEPCFGGGWFIVSAQLPPGQVTNHYAAEHWNVFAVPEVELPPEYDGHTPAVALQRLLQIQAPLGEGLEKAPATEDEREGLMRVVLGVEAWPAMGEHDETPTLTEAGKVVDALIAAGYRKRPEVTVEDVARTIHGWEAGCPLCLERATAVLALIDGEES